MDAKAKQLETELDLTAEKLGYVSLQVLIVLLCFAPKKCWPKFDPRSNFDRSSKDFLFLTPGTYHSLLNTILFSNLQLEEKEKALSAAELEMNALTRL